LTSRSPPDKTHHKPKTTVRIRGGTFRVIGMKIAYLDCFAGASGDMILGAFLDAGLETEALTKALKTLPLEGYVLQAFREERSHLFGTRFVVDADKGKQPPRTFADIRNIIRNSALSVRVKERSIRVFESLAAEEGKIHACDPETVHFHEVGAVDSIVDIVGAVFALESLGIESLYASPLPLGSGFVETRHGAIPLPAPATIALLKGIPVYDSGIKEELVTPTGAALLKALACAFGPMPPMVVQSIGYGVGARNLPDRPNLLRVLLGRDEQGIRTDTVVVLEANVDDANPEWLGYLMERLFREGALDVLFCPVHMKKNRPGVLIQVIGKPHHKDLLLEILFEESTTLGVRFRYSQRSVLERSPAELESPWGTIEVNKVRRSDGSFRLLPEYETCRRIALEKQLPIREIYTWVLAQRRQET
jgi:pyridinium-3,5-bisthiocarboxylic acid mononucleotide nickel chelatase